jgi:hypothetical protein
MPLGIAVQDIDSPPLRQFGTIWTAICNWASWPGVVPISGHVARGYRVCRSPGWSAVVIQNNELFSGEIQEP